MDPKIEGLQFKFGNLAGDFGGHGNKLESKRNPMERRVNSQDPRMPDQKSRIEMNGNLRNRHGYNGRNDPETSLSNPHTNNNITVSQHRQLANMHQRIHPAYLGQYSQKKITNTSINDQNQLLQMKRGYFDL